MKQPHKYKQDHCTQCGNLTRVELKPTNDPFTIPFGIGLGIYTLMLYFLFSK